MLEQRFNLIPMVKDQNGDVYAYLPLKNTAKGPFEAQLFHVDSPQGDPLITVAKRMATQTQEALISPQAKNSAIRQLKVHSSHIKNTHVYFMAIEEGTFIEPGKTDIHLSTFQEFKEAQETGVPHLARIKLSDLDKYFNASQNAQTKLKMLNSEGRTIEVAFSKTNWDHLKKIQQKEGLKKASLAFPNLAQQVATINENLKNTTKKIKNLNVLWNKTLVTDKSMRDYLTQQLRDTNSLKQGYTNQLQQLEEKAQSIEKTTKNQEVLAILRDSKLEQKKQFIQSVHQKEQQVIALEEELKSILVKQQQVNKDIKNSQTMLNSNSIKEKEKKLLKAELFDLKTLDNDLLKKASTTMEAIQNLNKDIKNMQLKEHNRALANMSEEITYLRNKINQIPIGKDNQLKQTLMDKKEKLEAKRDRFLKSDQKISDHPIVDRVGKAKLKEGEIFFHVLMGGYQDNDPSTYVQTRSGKIPYASGPDVVASILQKGVLRKKIDPSVLGNKAGNFGLGEYGPGLYLSQGAPSYITPVADKKTRRVRNPYMIVFKTEEALEGVYSTPINQYLREKKLPPLKIIEEYNRLLDKNFIADPTGNTEINLRYPRMKLVPIGVYEPQNIVISQDGNFNKRYSKLTPIEQFMRRHHVNLAQEWKSRLIKYLDASQYYALIRDEQNEVTFFKKLRGNTNTMAVKAEIGASQIAAMLIGSPKLIPPAREMTFRDTKGIAQPNIEFTSLYDTHGRPDGSVNFHRLSQKQRTQFFAHLLVNWVISNQDSLAQNFGIDKQTGDLISFDKGQAFKMFVGSKVTSPWVESQRKNKAFAGPENETDGKFYSRNLGRYDVHIENLFMQGLVRGKFDIDWNSPELKATIERIDALSKDTIKSSMSEYAHLQYKGKEEDFYQSIQDRASSVKAQVLEFSKMVPNAHYQPQVARDQKIPRRKIRT